MKNLATLVTIVVCSCAGVIAPEVVKIKSHPVYDTLSETELEVIDNIMVLALLSDKKTYYFNKLDQLLNTETVPDSGVALLNKASLYRSLEENENKLSDIVNLHEYLNREENYEMSCDRWWKKHYPLNSNSHFLVSAENDLDILVNISVRLYGDQELIPQVIMLEDAIEKHLARPGFSVNLILTDDEDYDADFVVKVDANEWTTSYNWVGSDQALGHELMHLMGLNDEYDRIESHATNRFMDRLQRLYQFQIQMVSEIPEDAEFGIMMFHNKKPLNRHICFAVGFGIECVEHRIKNYGEL